MDRLKDERGPEAAAPGEEPPRRGRGRAAAGAAPGAPAPRGAQRSRLRLGGRGSALSAGGWRRLRVLDTLLPVQRARDSGGVVEKDRKY